MLSGLIVCGRCGRPMEHAYWGKRPDRFSYLCRAARHKGAPGCFSLAGKPLDDAVQRHFLQMVTPQQVDLSLAVQREAGRQDEELARHWKTRIEKAEYAANLAERRYMAVDPDNRVVARTLESQWEHRLRELEDVRRRYEEQRRLRRVELDAEELQQIRDLAGNLSAVWHAPTTEPAERKAMLRLVIEAISVQPVDVPRRETLVRIQWCSGAVTELTLPRPNRRERSITPPEAMDAIRRLAGEGLREDAIAERLNDAGLITGVGRRWDKTAVLWVRNAHGITKTYTDLPRRHPMPDRHPDGRWSVNGLARRFDVSYQVAYGWLRKVPLKADRELYAPHGAKVFWIRLDDADAAELTARAARSHKLRAARQRRAARTAGETQ